MDRRAIVWFRQDLRLHDNEALTDALCQAREVFPVYVFDPRTLEGKTPAGFPKTGIHRTRFLLESVRDLRQQLRERGSELIVRWGKPENEIFNLARELRASWVFCNRERTAEEVQVQDRLEQNLWSIGREMRYSRGKMLLHTQDLPFPVTHTPEVFTHYRKEVDRIVPIRSPLPVPTLPEQDWRAITPGRSPASPIWDGHRISMSNRFGFPVGKRRDWLD